MDYYQLGELLSFTAGVNPTRVEKSTQEKFRFYDQASFEHDLQHEFLDGVTNQTSENSPYLSAGDVVISSPLRTATVVGRENEGKMLTLNFIKVEFKEKLDTFYFLYLFNQFQAVQRQKERELQGTGLSMRIPVKSLAKIRIPLPSLEQQRKIGETYRQMLLLQGQLKRYSQLLEIAVQTSLEQTLGSQSNG